VLLGFHVSPGEEIVTGAPISEARRNLALRKFRYWCARLGIAAALEPRATTVFKSAAYTATEVTSPPRGDS
jgi:hypothetical protein